ncbi:hypothetical protein BLNAU_10490 [Blattamonas nauphoetae]|uniref:C2H2-type domain-containing protein n=1 Tax=Blattamonas nauphoetae TaxID=2049346 RepID=A0ABQ9XSU3_9EUKA|nr:hypothetical protein BLNAU_10490 [Blattamonas nauphoetae]
MTALNAKPSSSADFSCPDCSPFLDWNEETHDSVHERVVVYRSLVATVKLNPALDASLEVKAASFLESVVPEDTESTNAFISSFAMSSDKSMTDFVQSIGVLISSASQVIPNATMKMLDSLFLWCSLDVQLDFVKADLITQLLNTLNPQSLSFEEAVDIHACLISITFNSVWLATPYCLAQLKIEEDNEQQAVHETAWLTGTDRSVFAEKH